MKKRILGVLLALVMVLGVLPTMAWAELPTTGWGGAMEGTYTVNSTVVLNNMVTVEKNMTLTLSGDGTIKRGSGCTGAMIEVKDGGKLVIEGSVTLDGNAGTTVTGSVIQVESGGVVEMNGGTIRNNNARLGGGVNNLGTFTLNGGVICENEAVHGGGVQNGPENTVDAGAQFNFIKGEIRDNKAVTRGGDGTGGGIRNKGELTMSGGTISGNTAQDGGCGVFNYYGTFIMTGGTITGNYGGERGGGVAHRDGSNGGFYISGAPKIYGNYAKGTKNGDGSITGGTPDNVGLVSSGRGRNRITINGAMQEGANVWVKVIDGLNDQTMIDAENTQHKYIVPADVTTKDEVLNYFHIDTTDKKFFKMTEEQKGNETTQVIIIALPDSQEITGDPYTLTITVNDADLGSVDYAKVEDIPTNNAKITVDGNTITVNGQTVTATPAAEDDRYTYAFSAWKDEDGNEISDDLEMNASMKIVAYFTKTEKTATGPEPAAPEQPTPAPVPAHSGVIRRFPAKTEAESGTEVDSAKTFDGGVAVYAALALVSAGGMTLMRRKRED